MQPFLKSELFVEQFRFGSKHWIGKNTTLLVPTQFANIRNALEYLDDKIWPDNVTITIKIAAGFYNLSNLCLSYASQSIEIKRDITISGDSLLTKTISSLGSTSGASNNWDVTLNISNTNGLTTGMFVLIDSVTGTGDYKFHNGCWKITNIPSSTQITVKNYNNKSTFVSTLTGGNITVPTTILDNDLYNSKTFLITNLARVNFENLIITSNQTPGSQGSAAIFYESSNCNFTNVGVSGYYFGIRLYLSKVSANNLYISGCRYGPYLMNKSILTYGKLYVTGNQYGIVSYGSFLESDYFKFGNSIYSLGHQYNDILSLMGSYVVVMAGGYLTTSPAINTIGNDNSYIKEI